MILNRKLHLQEILSISYIFLIGLGIVLDVLYYKILGINILDYSSITDVLLSPIKLLLHEFKFTIAVIVFLILGYIYVERAQHYFEKYKDNKNIQMWFDFRLDKSKPQKYNSSRNVMFLVFLISGILIGFRFGSASKIKRRIASNSLKTNTVIEFNDGVKWTLL
ncbi:MAG: hypothetical protein HOP11_04660 [Saprospiraceae bacterium]|nr:hypothetical protein [Saprospiraceae bacterium]